MTNLQIQPIHLGMVNCYLIKGQGCILVDTGLPGRMKTFLKTLMSKDTSPKEIDLIVLTHGHFDHVGLARDIKVLSGAKLVIHEREASWLENGISPIPPGTTCWGKVLSTIGKLIPSVKVPSIQADLLIRDDGMSLQPYGVPGEIIHTPGHTMGSISILLESGDAFVGDLAMNARAMRLTPGIPIFAEELSLVFKSWSKLLDLGAKRIFPAHGEPFSADVLRKNLLS